MPSDIPGHRVIFHVTSYISRRQAQQYP